MPRISARPRRLPRPPGRASSLSPRTGSIVSVGYQDRPLSTGVGSSSRLMAGLRRVDGTPSPSERSPAPDPGVGGRGSPSSPGGAVHLRGPLQRPERWHGAAATDDGGWPRHRLAQRSAEPLARQFARGSLIHRPHPRRRQRRVGCLGHGRGRWAARGRGGLGVRRRCGDDGQGHRLALGRDAACAALLLALLVGLWVTRRLAVPLMAVAGTARQFAAGTGSPDGSDGAGEIGEVARSLDEMADTVVQSEESRRRLASNVAHWNRISAALQRGWRRCGRPGGAGRGATGRTARPVAAPRPHRRRPGRPLSGRSQRPGLRWRTWTWRPWRGRRSRRRSRGCAPPVSWCTPTRASRCWSVRRR